MTNEVPLEHSKSIAYERICNTLVQIEFGEFEKAICSFGIIFLPDKETRRLPKESFLFLQIRCSSHLLVLLLGPFSRPSSSSSSLSFSSSSLVSLLVPLLQSLFWLLGASSSSSRPSSSPSPPCSLLRSQRPTFSAPFSVVSRCLII